MYEPSIIPLLVAILYVALSSEDLTKRPIAYIALTLRNEETMSDFLRQAGKCIRDRTLASSSEIFLAEKQLTIEKICAIPVTQNIFTGTAELGQDSATQVVKIFKIERKFTS